MAALLSLRLGCPLLPVRSWRENGRLTVEMEPPMVIERGPSVPQRVEAVTRQMNEILATVGSRAPYPMVMDSRSVENVTALPLFTVVIPTLGNHDILWQTLECLHQTDLSQAEVIVVFNGFASTVKRWRLCWRPGSPLSVVFAHRNPTGIARASNLGARSGQGRFVAFLHDDVMIHAFGWLAQLTDLLTRRPEVGLVGGANPKTST